MSSAEFHDPGHETEQPTGLTGWRQRWHTIVFESDTPAGKAFDLALIVAIVSSIVLVLLESIATIEAEYGSTLRAAEWAITILFTLEYLIRLACVRRPGAYAASFYGIIDLLAIAPAYLSLVVPGTHLLLTFRVLRLLRVFRIFKLGRFVREANVIVDALYRALPKITVFFTGIAGMVVILGSLMYVIEGPEHGFTSIPVGVYWAIVTLTTVGFGDITPKTSAGQALASLVMILGYSILAVPTGIVTAETMRGGITAPGAVRAEDPGPRPTATDDSTVTTRHCPGCSREGHDPDAVFCKHCGERL